MARSSNSYRGARRNAARDHAIGLREAWPMHLRDHYKLRASKVKREGKLYPYASTKRGGQSSANTGQFEIR